MVRKYYVEYTIEYVSVIGNMPITSNRNREATLEDYVDALLSHLNGNCNHGIFYDTPGWMYDLRSCGICDAGLGAI